LTEPYLPAVVPAFTFRSVRLKLPTARSAAVILFGLVLVYLSALLVASERICRGRRTWKILSVLPAVFATIHFTWGAGVLVNLLTLGKWPAMNGTKRQCAEPN
jgi:hypothetical protein